MKRILLTLLGFVAIALSDTTEALVHEGDASKLEVTRRMDGGELVWSYPRIEGDVRMKRIGQLPERVFRREPRKRRAQRV